VSREQGGTFKRLGRRGTKKTGCKNPGQEKREDSYSIQIKSGIDATTSRRAEDLVARRKEKEISAGGGSWNLINFVGPMDGEAGQRKKVPALPGRRKKRRRKARKKSHAAERKKKAGGIGVEESTDAKTESHK